MCHSFGSLELQLKFALVGLEGLKFIRRIQYL